MSRILFLVRSLEGGGAERQLLLLAKGLQRRGHEVTLAVYYRGGAYDRYVSDAGIRFVSLDKGGLHRNIRFFRRAVRLARSIQPDVVHGYLDTGNIIASALKPFLTNTRVVWGVRASDIDLSVYDLPGRVLFHLTRIASRSADLIISNSSSGASHAIRAGYPATRTVVIPNGIDTEYFRPAPEGAARLRGEWGVTPAQPLVGLVARLDPMKDHSTFAAAAVILASRRPDVKFICVGEGIEPYRSAALDTLRDKSLEGRLFWQGFSHEMPAVYSALDVATSSSAFGEGFSNAIAEAMACGTPCAVTDVGDSRMIVGDLGAVVPRRDPEALANAWNQLLLRRDPAFSTACRRRIVEEFGVEVFVARTERTLWPEGREGNQFGTSTAPTD